MELIAILLKYGLIIAVLSVIAYFVVKKAVKDAFNEDENDRIK
ncbi:MAG: hypothetical protein PUB20_05630 [Clostridia bacterium]|nr:hypothetical protein [Clostridia bacterium]